MSSCDRTKSLDPTFLSRERNNLIALDQEVCTSPDTKNIRYGEILLPQGDLCSESLLRYATEGFGTFVWPDGCMYEGEWRCGMRHGYGKIRWPSGALYEGEFSGGYIHGNGTYTRADGMTYKGRWRLSLKHGLGFQTFPNGDVFEGSWIRGTPEGPGKYTWANGNVYLGNMKGGKMSGKGNLTWMNEDCFKGNWLNGMMHGFGAYRWAHGSSYVGTWTKGMKDGKGIFYPKDSRFSAGQRPYLNALRKQGLLPYLRKQNKVSSIHQSISVDMLNVEVSAKQSSNQNSSNTLSDRSLMDLEQSRVAKVSLARHWSHEVSIEKVSQHRRSSSMFDSSNLEGRDKENDLTTPILEREYMQGVLISEIVLRNHFSPSSRMAKRRQMGFVRDDKKPGEQIIKGHKSYDLMLNLQLGIRYSVGKINPIRRREVRSTDFGPRASFWMTFPKEGSQSTPPHQAGDFKWKDYCPMIFRNLKEMFRIDAADYMMSICGNDALRQLSSPGKSGSVFFLSQDDRFVIKTLRKSELKVLLQMLPDYHRHVRRYENTLITKFFGLHRIKPSGGQKFRFVVMGNVFCTELRIHRRFDLKGSSLGRSADKVEIEENTILKDLDLNYCFYLEPSWRDALLQQIDIDSKFLESQRIMDYSLLLGVHYRAPRHLRCLMSYNRHNTVADELDTVSVDEISPQGLVLIPRGAHDKNSILVGAHVRGNRLRALSSTGNEEVDLLLPGTARLQIQLGVNMPARAELIPGMDDSETLHEAYDVVLYLGIIDILQAYNMSKKIERAYKSIQFDSLSISAVDPAFYSDRFLAFVRKVFPTHGG